MKFGANKILKLLLISPVAIPGFSFGYNSVRLYICTPIGELAQLVERLHGMQEVSGSNPLFSTLQAAVKTQLFLLVYKVKKLAS
jgi:hypothetical protein